MTYYSYDDDLNLTETQVDRIKNTSIDSDIIYILANLLIDGVPITGKAYYEMADKNRKKIKAAFKKIYIQHLRRSKLSPAESSVLSAAIPILLWHIQGKSFSEIVSLRHAFLSEKDQRRSILMKMKKKGMSASEAKRKISTIQIRYTPVPAALPNSRLTRAPLYQKGTSVDLLDFDTIVYDTYDYLDKVISLSLADPICAALDIFKNRTNDSRAGVLKNYIRYGTNGEMEIWLLKYGFGFEEIEWLKEHIAHVDASKITFKETINQLDAEKQEIISRYL